MKPHTFAFTLIELLIVVAIIGILAAIAVPNFLNAQMKAKISRCHADQKATATALEQYFLDWNSYPEDHDYPSDWNQQGLFRLTHPMPYLSDVPNDPFPSKMAKDYSEGNRTWEFGSGMAKLPQKKWPNQAYIIISPGPDRDEEVSGNDSFPFGVYVRSFDISNGLDSRGDIVRMGGQYNAGRVNFDGKWVIGGSQ